MKRYIEFSEGIVSGEIMEEVIKILKPIVDIKEYFKQRKTYFEYYFNEYSEHSKTFTANNSHCVHYVNRPNFILDKLGKDFEDYCMWTTTEIIEILSPEESQKYLEKDKDFYSNLTGIN